MIWDIVLGCVIILTFVFILMYVCFMSMLNSTPLSFKELNKLFWVFFKEYMFNIKD